MGPITTGILGVVGTVASIGGTLLGVKAAGDQAADAKAQAQTQAMLERRRAQDTQAIAQREAAHRAKQAAKLQSDLVARNAASGGGGLEDSTIMNLWNSIEQQGTYQTASIISDSQRAASAGEYQANLYDRAGDQAIKAGRLNQASALLSGASFAKYWDVG